MNITAFRDIALCSLVEVDRRFRDAYCLHRHDGRQYAHLKRRFISTRLHGATSLKAAIFTIPVITQI
jgi:hypothetical protein